MLDCPVDPRDPTYNDSWSDHDLEAALMEHLHPEERAQSPVSSEDAVKCDPDGGRARGGGGQGLFAHVRVFLFSNSVKLDKAPPRAAPPGTSCKPKLHPATKPFSPGILPDPFLTHRLLPSPL